jgi:zinc protease
MITTTRHLFRNGLTLLLVETHQAPVVSINICLRVGSRYESDREAGICHLIEHMLFKGTRRLAPGEVAKQIEANGGDVNAYTSFDETVYYCTLSSRHGDRGLDILSDAVLNSVIEPVELDREREVVVEEILRGKDSPGKVLSEALFKKAYQRHPYGRPIIGFEDTVRSFSRRTVYDFYRRWYVPRNTVVVVAGDFKTSHMLKRCERIFGGLPDHPSPPEKTRHEPAQGKPRALTLERPIQGNSMMLSYHVPALHHQDIPALDTLSHVLGEGESSRLDMRVKESRGLVNSIYSYVYTPQHPGLFAVGYTLPEKNISEATRAVFENIDELQNHAIDHDELARAKINIKSDAVYEKETVEGLARKYGYFETMLKRHDFDEYYYQQIDNVSRDDVLEVARKYLTPGNLTMGLISPKESKKRWKPKHLLAWCEPKKGKRPSKQPDGEVVHVRLKNGIRLIFKENHNVPTITLRTAQLGGIRSETQRSNGINSLLGQVWGKSTERFDAHEMARQVELIAGNIEAYTGRNLTGMRADFLSEKVQEGVDLFLDAFLRPRFDPREIKREKAHVLEAIRREKDALASLAFKYFLQTLYPKHPYGMPMLGEAKNVRRFTRQDLLRQFRDILNPRQMVIAVVGDFDRQWMLDRLGPVLETLPRNKVRLKNPKPDPEPKKSVRIEKVLEKHQAHIVYGVQGLSFQDKDRYALDVLNNILAGQGGRLFLELRDKMSLAYSVTSMSQEGIEPGYFGVYIASEGSKVETAVRAIERELKKVLEKNVSHDEMRRAKEYMVGAYDIELQKNAAVATNLAFNEIYDLSRDEWLTLPKKILKVSREDVARVARRILKLDRHILSIVRPSTHS